MGVGASAGGLATAGQLLSLVPADSGAAFVLIQHLDPTHPSLTAELLGRKTAMRVVEVQRNTRVVANQVYVIPSDKYLSLRGRTLLVTAPLARRGLRMPVDFFLRSLARSLGSAAVGIILSGTGSDGALGLREIKAAGGMTMAQDPTTAQYDGMPRSAIDAGAVDHVLAVADMPALLLRWVRQPYVHEEPGAPAPGPAGPYGDLEPILAILRARARFDFGAYREGTMRRRIRRRMSLRHLDSLSGYRRLLEDDAAEVVALRRDLLIHVTSFFREPEM